MDTPILVSMLSPETSRPGSWKAPGQHHGTCLLVAGSGMHRSTWRALAHPQTTGTFEIVVVENQEHLTKVPKSRVGIDWEV